MRFLTTISSAVAARRRLALLGCWLLGALVFGSTSAASHPFDSGNTQPRSYADAVHFIREELDGIRRARASGNSADLSLCAARLAVLAGSVPEFALSLPGALQDSAAGRILQTAHRLGAIADALGRASESDDRATIALLTSRCADLQAILDAYVPKQYVCPMHCEPGKVYDRPGTCPVCQMHLQWITSDLYGVEVRPLDGALRARVPVTLHFQIRDPAGFDVDHLQVVHEKLLHLMVVSQDLSWFAHQHPVPGPHGSFELRTRFPAGGTYVLFHDFTPDSVGMQVVPVEVSVAGTEPPAKALVVDDDRPKRVDGCDVALAHSRLVPGTECTMTFTLTRHGEPVTDLEPFLGAAGHLVLISQDRSSYLHSHPLELSAGPSVEFKLTFARTGIYKAWGQFQRNGRVLTIPFVVEVTRDGQRLDRSGTTSLVR